MWEKSFSRAFILSTWKMGRRSQCAGIIHTWAACFATGFGGESGRKVNPLPNRECACTLTIIGTLKKWGKWLIRLRTVLLYYMNLVGKRERCRWREIKREREKRVRLSTSSLVGDLHPSSSKAHPHSILLWPLSPSRSLFCLLKQWLIKNDKRLHSSGHSL